MHKKSKAEYEVSLRRVTVASSRLPAALAGMRILMFGDVHMKGQVTRTQREAMHLLNSVEADLMVFTGDMVSHVKYWPAASDWLQPLSALSIPKLAIPGNWDYDRNRPSTYLRKYMTASGFNVLDDAWWSLPVGDSSLDILGINDIRWGLADLPHLARPKHDWNLRLLLSHNPDILRFADSSEYDLVLSGHTHGGQIRIPGYGALITSTRLGKCCEYGLYTWDQTARIYVTSGLGTTAVPFRINCAPEVVLITLEQKKECRPRL